VKEVLLVYKDGDASDNGRAAAIKNIRTASGGIAVHLGFGVEALLSRQIMACVIGKILGPLCFGFPQTYVCPIQWNGVDAPEVASPAFGFALARAQPNPFDRATEIRFRVPVRTHVSIEVYNVLGQRVRTLVSEPLAADSYVREWDGRSDAGEPVSSGIYFCKMVAGEFTATQKTVLLR
jgi:hypothetical protein